MTNSRLPALQAGIALIYLATLAACSGGGGGGRAPSPSPAPAPVDSTPPETTLGTGPNTPTSVTSASFTFTSNEAGMFEGRLDGGAFAAVTSPHTLSNLAEGTHTFEVRARDAAGNVDATPASATWVVDTTPPDTQITAAPATARAVNTATFTVTSTETGGTFEASIDGGAFGPVTIPYTPAGLADGAHTIQFRARDGAGNVDASPASASWTLDVTPAQVNLLFPTRSFYTDAATLTVRGTAQDLNGVAGVSVNGVDATSTDNFAHWTAVVPVPVTALTNLVISSIDVPGNVDMVPSATLRNRGPFINTARGIAYDAQRNGVLVIDQATGDVVAFDRTTGLGQMLSPGPAPGTTPGSGFEEMVIDAANDRALILRQHVGADEIIAVNLATGARSVVSPSSGDSSPTRLTGSFCLALDAANQRLYVGAGIVAAIVQVNLATGERSIVSSDTVGTGESLVNPYGLVFDNVSNPNAPRLLSVIAPFSGSKILSIDLATGNRTTFSSATVGTGPPLANPLSMVMDAAGQRVLVNDITNGAVVAVDLATGNRSTISSFNVGTGQIMSWGIGLAFDPASRTAFGPTSGGFGELNTLTQVRRVVAHADVGTGDRIGNVVGLAVEQTTGTPTSLVFVDGSFGLISRVALATGNRSTVYWPGVVGSGPSLDGAVDMVLDRRPSTNGRSVLVLVGSTTPRLVSVDLTTGVGTLIADISAGVVDNAPQRMALDVTNNRVLFTNNESQPPNVDQVYAVNLANGDLTLVSGSSNIGPEFVVPRQIVLEPAASPVRALVGDFYSPQILAIDLASGNRSIFDSSNTGSGITYSNTGPMIVDTARGRLLAHHIGYPSNLFARPLAGGARELISGANPQGLDMRGSGPPFFYVQAMDVDFAADVGYVASTNNGSIIAVDLVSGDRVVIAH